MGHKVTIFSFDPIPELPDGVGNSDAEVILPRAFAERLRPSQADGTWRDWTILQFSDFFRMRLMREGAGLSLDADVLLLKPAEIDLAKPYFAWERPHQLGNSALYLPPDNPIVRGFERLMRQKEFTPNWLSLRHRLAFALRRWRGDDKRLADMSLAIFGPPALTALARRAGELHHALPKRSFYAVHSEPQLFFEPGNFTTLIADPRIIGLHISPKARCHKAPLPGSLHAWAVERFGQ